MLMDVLAGVVAGLSMGTIFLGVLIFMLYSNPDIHNRLSARLPQGISPTMVLLAILIAVPPLWGIFGALAGVVYSFVSISLPYTGLGSPNLAFTIASLSIGILIVIGLFILRRRLIRLGLILAVAFAGIFGWVLPLLANWR
ncbi:MAG: LPXTG cell wall anchor domain-containing protein [Chloroflexota bacterium]|nr:LPXTG cell wall anchor domain-containing protein [Chloroflexota bacterium]